MNWMIHIVSTWINVITWVPLGMLSLWLLFLSHYAIGKKWTHKLYVSHYYGWWVRRKMKAQCVAPIVALCFITTVKAHIVVSYFYLKMRTGLFLYYIQLKLWCRFFFFFYFLDGKTFLLLWISCNFLFFLWSFPFLLYFLNQLFLVINWIYTNTWALLACFSV